MFVPLCANLAVLANGWLDRGPVATHAVRVRSVTTPADRDGAGLLVIRVASWLPGRDEIDLHVRDTRVSAGDVVLVDTRPGALGFPRIVAVRDAHGWQMP